MVTATKAGPAEGKKMSPILSERNPVAQPKGTARKTLRITVLMGGPGSEREVSLESGRAVADALESLGHHVSRTDINPTDLRALDREADVVFIALHGEFGEDGALQRVLDQRGIRYVGSGPDASELVMDKVRTKETLVAAGIATPEYQHVTRGHMHSSPSCYKLPAVAKPVSGGSSVDVTISRHPLQLLASVERLVAKYGECLVEDFIAGPELTVGILGEKALDPLLIRTRRDFYDYRAKYQDSDTEYLFDIGLPKSLLAQVRRDSLRAHQALGCRDFSRVDWMVDERTGRAWCLEINTIPGFTSHSLLPKMAARSGLGFPALCQRIVELAMQR